MAVIKGIGTVSTKVGGSTQKFGQSQIFITDYRDIIKALNNLEGEILKEFFKGAKDILSLCKTASRSLFLLDHHLAA